MRRWIMVAVVLLAGLPGNLCAMAQGTPVASPNASPAVIVPDASCYGWEDYAKAMRNAPFPISDEELDAVDATVDIPFRDYATIRSENLLIAAGVYDAYAGRAGLIENVPSALADLHQDYIDRLVLISRYMTVNVDADVLSIAFYSSRLDDNSDQIIEDVKALYALCGDQWIEFASSSANPYFAIGGEWYIPNGI